MPSLIDILRLPKVQLVFFSMGILEGVDFEGKPRKWLTMGSDFEYWRFFTLAV